MEHLGTTFHYECGDFFKPKTQTADPPILNVTNREARSTSQPPTFESSGHIPRMPKVYIFSFMVAIWSSESSIFQKQKAQRFSSFGFSWTSRVTRSPKKKVSQNIEVTKKWPPSPFSLDTSLTFPTTGCFVEIFPALDVSLPNFEKSMYGLELLAIYIDHKKSTNIL